MILSILPIVALVGASNLSTAIIILGIGIVLVFVASPKYSQFIVLGTCGIGFMGIFASTYSQLYKVDNHGNKLLIYDVNSFQFFRILIYFVGIAVFASIVIIGVIKEFKKAQRENVNGL